MTAVLYVAARAPRPGFTKTRLGQSIGDEKAARLYLAFLRDLAERLARVRLPVGWYITPDDAWNDLAPLVESTVARDGWPRLSARILLQGPGDWAARQQALFRDAPVRGETRTILIASDSPHLDLGAVAEAFELLESHDLVLGPTFDGGYYLIGMRGPWDVLSNVRMSTTTVLAEIVERARRLGLSVGFVPPTFDVDEVDDLARLAAVVAERDDLPATRTVLTALGWITPKVGPGPGTRTGPVAGPLKLALSPAAYGRYDSEDAAP